MNITDDRKKDTTTPSWLIDFSIKLFTILRKTAIILLVVLAILVGITRSLFPYIDHYRTWFEQKLSDVIDQPVEIGQVQASWKGLHPRFKFSNVVVFDDAKHQRLVNIPAIEISVNVVSSLLNLHFVPQALRISGMSLSIYEGQDRLLEINGIKTTISTHSSAGTAKQGVQQFFHWLLSQGEISLDHIDIDWHGRNGMVLPLTDMQLTLRHGFFQQQMIGLATLAQKIPAKFRFVITLEGDLLKNQALAANTYIYVKDMEIEPWMKQYAWQGVTLTHGRLNNLQLWANWEQGQFQDIQSLFNFKAVGFYSTVTRQALKLTDFSGNVAWQRNKNGWTAAADHLTLNVSGHTWLLSQLGLTTATHLSGGQTQVLKLDALDLARFDQLLFLFPTLKPSFRDLMTDLQPRGTLKNIIIRRDIRLDASQHLSIATDFEGLEVLPWKNIPGITGLSGHIMANSFSGRMRLQGKKLGLDFAGLFPSPLAFEQYAAHIEWLKTEDEWQIHVNDFNMDDSVLNLAGGMDLFLSTDSAVSPFIALDMAFVEKNPQYLPKYIPVGVLPQGLTQWFNEAFIGSGNITGQLLLHGPIRQFPFDQQQGRFEMIASVNNMAFNYRTGWPVFNDLTANILLDGRRLLIEADQSEIFSAKAKNIHAEIADLATAALIVEGSVDTDSTNAMAFIFQSPLDATLGQKLKALHLSGPIQLNLGLVIPLHQENPPLRLHGHVDLLSGGKLTLPSWGISLENVEGAFDFSENAITTDKVIAQWINHPLNISIVTDHPAADESIIQVKVSGEMSIQDIEKAYALSSLDSIITGSIDYDATLNLINRKGKESTLFSINSDLAGITIGLPSPLAKNAQTKIPTNVQLEFGGSGTHFFDLSGRYGKILSTALRFSENTAPADHQEHWGLTRGEIRFGAEPAVLGNAAGLRIKGGLSALNWSDLSPWLSPFLSQQNKHKPAIAIDQIDLNIGTLNIFGLTLQPINIKVKSQSDGWRVEVANPNIAGWFILPPANSKASIEGEFTRFYLTPAEKDNPDSSSVNPADFPSLNIRLNDFRYGQRMFGKLFFITSRQQNAMRINKLVLTSPYSVMNATGFWQKLANGKTQSTLSGEFHATNMGKVLRSLRITESLVDASGRATFALSWPSEIYRPNFGRLDGRFSFDFQNGRIINMSQSSEAEMGLGRMLNLLSLQSLPRRLTLDFSDLSEKGFSFDIVKGDFVLNDGDAVTNNTYMDGTIAKVELTGEINVNKKTYHLSMLVTPYVTSSLPVVATIAGGPVAGAAVWVAHKVFGGVVNNISSALYRVTGPWDAPEVSKSSTQQRLR